DSPATAEVVETPADGDADLRTEEEPDLGTGDDRPPYPGSCRTGDETGHDDTRYDEAGLQDGPSVDVADDDHPDPDHPDRDHPDRGLGDAAGPAVTGDRDTDARTQHPAAQDPPGRPRPDPSGNGHRLGTAPSRDGVGGPAPGPDLGGRLNPNEQELLRRLQEELAARDDGAPGHGPHNGSARPDAG
ncbi:MAG: hypothetical protein L0I76_30790, partial [Pseudonocardia sp.]|nr:hypothetical protein [Pseudonocardia sp.]